MSPSTSNGRAAPCVRRYFDLVPITLTQARRFCSHAHRQRAIFGVAVGLRTGPSTTLPPVAQLVAIAVVSLRRSAGAYATEVNGATLRTKHPQLPLMLLMGLRRANRARGYQRLAIANPVGATFGRMNLEQAEFHWDGEARCWWYVDVSPTLTDTRGDPIYEDGVGR